MKFRQTVPKLNSRGMMLIIIYRLLHLLYFLLMILGLPLGLVMEVLRGLFLRKSEDKGTPDEQLGSMMDRSFICGLVTLALIIVGTCYLLLV
jgi:hypothetical protein